MNQYGPPPGDYFPPEMDPYYHAYEPPQDPSWGGQVRVVDHFLNNVMLILKKTTVFQPPWAGNIDMKNMIPLSNGSDVQARGGVNGTPDIKVISTNI